MAMAEHQESDDPLGRTPSRADSRRTHERLIEAVSLWASQHGAAPERLSEVAATAGVSTATAYRHFKSVDDVITAFVLQLPQRAVELFAENESGGDAELSLYQWNRAWVDACLECGPLAVHLRSRAGFLERRASGDRAVVFASRQIEPILEQLEGDPLMMLFVWNVTSDPREVLDLQLLGWGGDKIARFVTDVVLATPESH